MSWIESHTTLREHPKRKRLSRLLNLNVRETIGLLHMLWWWSLDFAPEGDLSAFSDEDVADSIDWEGDAYALMASLQQAGFVDRDRRIHDWDEFAEKWIERRRANAERMRLARSKRNGVTSAAHVADTSGARAPQTSKSVGLPDLPDQPYQPTGPDLPTSSSPTPPPQAEEGERQSDGTILSVDPPTTGDVTLWKTARERLRVDMTPGNWDQLIAPLEPLGRAPDGGLRLRAPPGQSIGARVINGVRRALLDAGDARAKQSAIVEQ